MSYNDTQQHSHHLLNWLNHERTLLGQSHRIYSFEQLKQSHLLPSLLSKIHPTYFANILTRQFDYQRYLMAIQNYLIDVEDLRIKRMHRQRLMESQNLCEIVLLVLFMVMRHQIKEEFVGRILELEEASQIYLMNQLKRIQSVIENNIEIRQIYQKIQQLQEENEVLNERVKDIEHRNAAIKVMKEQTRDENDRLVEQYRNNNAEKLSVMQQLGLHQMQDYLSIYKDIEHERTTLINSHTQLQQISCQLQQTNQQMQEKLVEDNLIISHLNQQILRYREIYQQLKGEKEDEGEKQIIFGKENQYGEVSMTASINHLRMSFSYEATSNSFKNIPTIEEEDEPYTNTIKTYNQDLFSKLQSMYNKIGALNDQISVLREENNHLMRSTRRKQAVIALSKREFSQFQLNYQFTISG